MEEEEGGVGEKEEEGGVGEKEEEVGGLCSVGSIQIEEME